MNTFSYKVVHKITRNRPLDMSHARASSKVDGHEKLKGPEKVNGLWSTVVQDDTLKTRPPAISLMNVTFVDLKMT